MKLTSQVKRSLEVSSLASMFFAMGFFMGYHGMVGVTPSLENGFIGGFALAGLFLFPLLLMKWFVFLGDD